MLIEFTVSDSENDLQEILALQKANLARLLTLEEAKSQGFVTVQHRYDELKRLNDIEKHIVAKDRGCIVAYVLAMTKQSRHDLPILIPMFEIFDTIKYMDKVIADYNYIVVGQACVDKGYRGKGILDKCYEEYKQRLYKKYDFAITEIACKNLRSVNAHRRIGFKEVHRYTASDGTEWSIVIWDWRRATSA